jgi:3-deoxy-D-arabino-heptulosonate 7-phosphate (DAHP) synthase class II
MVTCISDYRQVLDWMIGFIDTLDTVLGTTGNYSAIADLHTLQFTVTHALGFSVFTSHIQATVLYESHCNFNHT